MLLDKDEIIGALNDLTRSLGWSYVVKKLNERRNRYLAALLAESSTGTLADVRALQASVKEIDFFVKLPEQEMRILQASIERNKEA